ncbi:MAG: ABC transporter permease subunit [Meiothermus sp.]|uniref:ABC transporter permease n=1 Tax=Meiothermus sp. TaxID=1955249 RepID=UPI0025E08453|nr:ABC transporter permease subunit [Meiothermus sp.]MCS7069415.1 ABC transporter permease subunit [Meiothermus sp.]MCX7602003.1 ABC transporter permease subunit [Meiothermus sp.]MDW8425914.1 ABC transporter permease subunit [Meiothermus sp.]
MSLGLRWASVGIALLFVLFLLLFEVLPGLLLARVFWSEGQLSLASWAEATRPLFQRALRNSIELAFYSALQGAVLGTLTAWALWSSANPLVKRFTTGLSAVAANFAGPPLAFAFIVLLGGNGFLNLILKGLGLPTVDIYGKEGLYWVYLYFQWPLMTVLMLPAFGAIQREWLEAARSLGSNQWGFWWRVGIPVLLPSILGSYILLFANAFGAYATVYALTQGQRNLLPLQIGFQVGGDIGYNPVLASTLALMMALVLAVSLVLYRLSRRWAARMEQV